MLVSVRKKGQAKKRMLAACMVITALADDTARVRRFHADLRSAGQQIVPNTTWDSISSFTWIGNWDGLDPALVAKLNISSRYPFLRYAELFTATGGCEEGFVDHQNKTCKPWLRFDAHRSPNGTYVWDRLMSGRPVCIRIW